jgi:hypothetical protein
MPRRPATHQSSSSLRLRHVAEFLRAFTSVPRSSAVRQRLRQVAAPLLPIVGWDPTSRHLTVLFRSAIFKAQKEFEAISWELKQAIRLKNRQTLVSLLLQDVPRLAALIKAEQSAVALVEEITGLSRRLEEQVRAKQYQLIRQFRRDPKAYFKPVQFIKIPSFRESSGDFAIVIDFSTGRSIASFLAAALGAFEGRSMHTASQTILKQLSDAGFRLVVGPKRARLEPVRGAAATTRTDLTWTLVESLNHFLGPSLKKLWDQVVSDFFLKEPTSVSRWFPQRPMARKGLHTGTRQNSLLGMLQTGRVEFAPVADYRGIAGAFTGFEVQRAPYWPIVQYGYSGEIVPRERKFLALRDPPGWQSVTWFFGVPATASKVSKRSITLHSGVRRSFYYHSSKVERAAIRTTLPSSGTRFWFRTKSKEATKPFVPVVSTEIAPVLSRKRKVVTYAIKTQITYRATAKGPAVFQRKVQGQRPSMFIERILARFAERQTLLSDAVLRAGRAYVELGEKLFTRFLESIR